MRGSEVNDRLGATADLLTICQKESHLLGLRLTEDDSNHGEKTQ